jgi:hypothetical protein
LRYYLCLVSIEYLTFVLLYPINLSGVLNETPKVHIDLFEVIKKAIGSSDTDLKQSDDNDDITKASIDSGETKAATVVTTSSNFETMFSQVIAAFLSLTSGQQIAVLMVTLFVTLYTVGAIIYRNNDSSGTEDLAQRVDELSNEIREMKIILERLIALSERNVDLREEL